MNKIARRASPWTKVMLALCLLGSFALGWSGTAQAAPEIWGPMRWTGSMYPGTVNLTNGVGAEDAYCWLTGYSLGSVHPAETDSVYVFLGSDRNWHLGGSASTGVPSSSTWGEAMCVMYLAPSAIFQPWESGDGVQTFGGCPASTDPSSQGACFRWSAAAGLISQGTETYWTPANVQGDQVNLWTNTAFCSLSGIAYSGYSQGAQLQGVIPAYPDSDTRTVLEAHIQNSSGTMQLAAQCLWPPNNLNLFWSGNAGATVTSGSANPSQGMVNLGPNTQLCGLAGVFTSGVNEGIMAEIVPSGGHLFLQTTGTSSAGAICISLPYATN